MDIALQDIKYRNSISKINELEKKLETTYSKLKSKDNPHLQFVLDNYKKYIKTNDELKEKKREALENILEHIEKIETYKNSDLRLISKELKKIF